MRKPAPPRDIPPPLELACLAELWRSGDGSVRDVQTRLAPSRKLAYTTVMTLLDRLAKRGFVSRTRSGRMFIYGAVLSKDKAREAAVQALLDVWFGGSRQELANYLGGVAVQAVPEPHPQPPVDEPIDTTLL